MGGEKGLLLEGGTTRGDQHSGQSPYRNQKKKGSINKESDQKYSKEEELREREKSNKRPPETSTWRPCREMGRKTKSSSKSS